MRHKLGWLPDRPDHRDLMFTAPAIGKLPESVDLRHGLPKCYDQGQLGSCTANAIAGALQFDRRKQGIPDWTPSRLLIYYMERAKEGTVQSDSGAMIRDGIKCVATRGACDEMLWPYDISKFADQPSHIIYAEAKRHTALRYARISHSVQQMRACLASGYPFVFGFTVFDSLETDEVAKTGIVPMPGRDESALGGHAVLCVGYQHKKKRFIVRNSWSSEWGDHGHCYMPYNYLSNPNLADDFWKVSLVM